LRKWRKHACEAEHKTALNVVLERYSLWWELLCHSCTTTSRTSLEREEALSFDAGCKRRRRWRAPKKRAMEENEGEC